MQEVKAEDEWCAEAYMETDYSALTKTNFELVVKNYAIFRLLGDEGGAVEEVVDANN